MHIDKVCAPTSSASIIVSFEREPLLLFPWADVRGHLAASPKVAFLGLLRDGFQLIAAFPATYLALGTRRGLNWRPADLACDNDFAAAAPALGMVARLGAVTARSCRNLAGRPIERLSAVITRKRLAVLSPVECLAGHAFVPCRSFRGGISAISVAVSSRAVFAWDGLSAVLAWMWSELHPVMVPRDNEYVEMAEAAE